MCAYAAISVVLLCLPAQDFGLGDQSGVVRTVFGNESSNSEVIGGMLVSAVSGDVGSGNALFLSQDGLIASRSPDSSGVRAPRDREYSKITGDIYCGGAIDAQGNLHVWWDESQDSFPYIEVKGSFIDVDHDPESRLDYVVALTADGKVEYHGREQDVEAAYQCYPPPAGKFKSVETAGNIGSCFSSGNYWRWFAAVDEFGSISCWGDDPNNFGVLSPPAFENVKEISISKNTGRLITEEGSFYSWGSGFSPDLSGQTFERVEASGNEDFALLTDSGSAFFYFGTTFYSLPGPYLDIPNSYVGGWGIMPYQPATFVANPSNLIDVALEANSHDQLNLSAGEYLIDRDWFSYQEVPPNPNDPTKYSNVPLTLTGPNDHSAFIKISTSNSSSNENLAITFESCTIILQPEGASANRPVFLNSCAFRDCKIQVEYPDTPNPNDPDGDSAIYCQQSYLLFEDCVFENFADVPAIFLNDADVTLISCEFNNSNYGISGNGTASVLQSQVDGTNAIARPFFSPSGGGLVLNVFGSRFFNFNSDKGSVISTDQMSSGYSLSLRGGVFFSNYAVYGGVIYSDIPTQIRDSFFYQNNAFYGGSIYSTADSLFESNMQIIGCHFQENNSTAGGEVLRINNSDVLIDQSVFVGNSAPGKTFSADKGIFRFRDNLFCQDISSFSDIPHQDLGGNLFPESCDLPPLECDVDYTGGEDCDSNGIDDLCQQDTDGDGVIDPCDSDDDNDGIPDECDVEQTGGQDCDSNGQDDLCDPDCDGDGIPDGCDPICDSDDDGIPDKCDVDQNPGEDCDQNGQLDSCDPDCDSDGIPDGCDAICDSDGDGIPDDCDIDQTGGADCDANGEDDSCQTDCDGDGLIDVCDNDDDNDGIPDPCDASSCGADGPDCDLDGLIDFCESDCNFDGVPDDCQDLIDCDGNGVPDECQSTGDSDGDGLPDVCDPDDDGDGIPDECDIDTTGGADCDANGVDDACQEDSDGDGVIDPCDDDDDCGILGCDSDGDGILDKCDIDETGGFDCDLNGVDDLCQEDTDSDGTIDPCDPDDDGDGIPDECDVDLTGGVDCNANGQDDFCEPDCDGDGLIDPCDSDRDGDGIPDDCDASGCGLEGIDCDGNGVLDVCDPDCDGDGAPDACDDDDDNDGLPDECDPDSCDVLQDDCQPDGIADVCQLEGNDCNSNGVPDDCEAIDPDQDCNLNGIPDVCDPDNSGDPGDPATFPSNPSCTPNGIPDDCDDCNQNGFPDVWDLDPDTAPLSFDCNGNCVPDECDIASGFSEDADGNGQPDECQPDCNNDGIPEFEQCPFNPNGDVPCPIYPFSPCLQDCNQNGIPDCCDAIDNNNDSNGDWIPDECQTNDCNQNGIDDAIDIADGFPDCNENGIIDICDVASGSFEDCNDNLVPDVCEPSDCNANDIQDSCEIEQDPTRDANGNGILDECENPCPEDLDLNGTVDFADLLLLLGSYGPCLPGEPCPADVDQSGEVDFADLLSVLGAWGDACTP